MKLYLNLGLQLRKFRRILEFKQEPFLKPYIEHITALRREVKKEVNKIKVFIVENAVFSTSIENPMNSVDLKPVTTMKQ